MRVGTKGEGGERRDEEKREQTDNSTVTQLEPGRGPRQEGRTDMGENGQREQTEDTMVTQLDKENK